MAFKIITIGLMAAFYICYFLKMIRQRKQGISTDQLGKGKNGFVKFIEVTLKISTYILPVLQLVSIWQYIGTAPKVLRVSGCIITAVGVLIFIISVAQMKDNWRAGVQREDKTNLVTTGIYSISRNPAFLGFDLMYIGILFTFFNLLKFIYDIVKEWLLWLCGTLGVGVRNVARDVYIAIFIKVIQNEE